MSWPLLAFGFHNVLMLGWLAAAALPVIIHLWNRRRYREVSWAAMEYLLAALRKNSRRIRIENWLLLAIRLAIIVLVVLAVADPYMQHAGGSVSPGVRTLKVLVLDGSYSMAYTPGDKSRFDWAKELAREIIADSRQGDAYSLVLMADPPSVVISGPAMEASAVSAELAGLKLSHGGADLPATLQKVSELLHSAAARNLERKEVYFLTDLGRNTWAPERLAATGTRLQAQLDELAAEAALIVLDLGQPTAPNRAISDLRLADPYAVAGQPVNVEAQLRNFGTETSSEIVQLLLDGRAVKQQKVQLPSRGQTAVTFSLQVPSTAEHTVEARLSDDRLALDDRRFLSLPVRSQLRVLCVNGKPSGDGLLGAADYLALALNPAEGADDTRIHVDVANETALMERDLSSYDCIFMCNVAQFTADEAALLDHYLRRGGGVVFTLGDQVLASRYNQQLAGILPAQIGPLVGEGQHRFDPLAYRHPLIKAFAGREQAGLLTTPVSRYFRLTVPPNSRTKVALAFSGGDPAIVETQVHAGRSIMLATDVSLSSVDPTSKRPWTMLPVWPSYVPLVQELLSLAVSGKSAQRNVRVGQAISGKLGSAGETLSIQTPDGQLRKAHELPSEQTWKFDETSQLGIYRAGAKTDTPELYAVNLDTAESDLTKLRLEQLPRQFRTSRPDKTEVREAASASRSALAVRLLYGAFCLLLAESLLAWRFGNRAA